ncbi:hypothetical protein GCM10010219_49730 [Streptomyces netropsis]|nr:hypothetical protein GCM10010219_49730 [Streptomyces netropsis]
MCCGSAQIIGSSAWASTVAHSSGRPGRGPPVVRPLPFIRSPFSERFSFTGRPARTGGPPLWARHTRAYLTRSG